MRSGEAGYIECGLQNACQVSRAAGGARVACATQATRAKERVSSGCNAVVVEGFGVGPRAWGGRGGGGAPSFGDSSPQWGAPSRVVGLFKGAGAGGLHKAGWWGKNKATLRKSDGGR